MKVVQEISTMSNIMNHTSASININTGIEKHDLSIFTAMLVFTYMNSSSIRKSSSSSSSSSSSRRRRRSSSSSKAMLLITVV